MDLRAILAGRCGTTICSTPAVPVPTRGPPQRVDRFDDDIANIVTNSAKRSGLTFAPEAGTQVGAGTLATREPEPSACLAHSLLLCTS